jgi:hypothetical protein
MNAMVRIVQQTHKEQWKEEGRWRCVQSNLRKRRNEESGEIEKQIEGQGKADIMMEERQENKES